MHREQAYELLTQHLTTQNLINHSLAVEAVMRRLARHFNEDEELWGLAGLLHDIDYDNTKDDPEKHSLMGAEMLAEQGFSDELVYAVKVHNEIHGLPRESLLDKALYATDPLTGLIVAGALIRPEKKLEAVKVKSLLKRFNEKSFAKGANRDQISSCSELGLSLEEFLNMGLEAMQGVAVEMGL